MLACRLIFTLWSITFLQFIYLFSGPTEILEELSRGGADLLEYEVEKIVSDRSKTGTTEFLIKWEGFSEADNTWEPAENIPSKIRW